MRLFPFLARLSCALLVACTGSPKPIEHPVTPRSPGKDTGQKSQNVAPGPSEEHAAALEQLLIAPLQPRTDRQKSIKVPLPDPASWRRVRFLGLKSLVGFRYGTEHHAVAGAFILDVKDRTADSCQAAFEAWVKPWLEVFEVQYEIGKPVGFTWRNGLHPTDPPEVMSAVTLHASTASLLAHESYHGTYAIYPAWADKCLVVGMAAAGRGEEERAGKARDRFAQEVFPHLEVTAAEAPTKAF